jgi:hypothetical protein
MPEPGETDVLAILHDLFTCKTTLAQRLALLKLTTKLARMLSSGGVSLHETRSCSADAPHGGLFSHGSRETSGVHVDEPGGTLYATPTVSR